MNFRETLGRHLLATLADPLVLHLEYRESESWLTLVFEHRGDEWLMVQHQNTPVGR